MNRPDNQTSNYGWALWHLEQVEQPDSNPKAAPLHASMAQARATLALIDAQTDSFHGWTWSGDTIGDKP